MRFQFKLISLGLGRHATDRRTAEHNTDDYVCIITYEGRVAVVVVVVVVVVVGVELCFPQS